MDHFARPDDELAIAQREGSLYRNFQGYSTHADCDLMGFGITSIGKVANTYSQNLKGLEPYYAQIDSGHLPVLRGIELNRDDELRRDVITRLICNFELHFADVEQQWGIVFKDYFSAALEQIEAMQADGLLTLNEQGVSVHAKGRLLIRNICMHFDNYLANKRSQSRFSKVI
jgi:oxygen-independent coproporphyrinogen-3 oxidase